MKAVKRAFLAAVILAFWGVIFTISIYHLTDRTASKYIVTADEVQTADCIIVPGAGVYGSTPSLTLANRLDTAIEVYQSGKTDRIIVSGDHGRDEYDEVNIMRDYLVERGIPAEHIFMDHAGFSTYDTLYRARDVFMVESAVVVTQELHLMRALYIADKLGLKCEGVVAQNSTAASTRVQQIREYPARVKAFAECLFGTKPKYLGEPIPVSGSGLVTEG